MMIFWVDLRLRALNYWLRNLHSKGPPRRRLRPCRMYGKRIAALREIVKGYLWIPQPGNFITGDQPGRKTGGER